MDLEGPPVGFQSPHEPKRPNTQTPFVRCLPDTIIKIPGR